MFLYRYFKEWRKNPHWSFSCCLGLLLPLSDLQGEIHGLVDADILKNQLQTGQFDQPTILSTVKDSGAIDIFLEEDEQLDGNRVEIQDANRQDVEHGDTKRHQGTQTELCRIPIADFVAHGPMTDSHEKSLCVKYTNKYPLPSSHYAHCHRVRLSVHSMTDTFLIDFGVF